MAKAGHNSGKGGPIDPVKLKSYVERIEAVEAEEADYKATKKDIYVEVKAAGMRPKMVRRIVKERKKTEADAEDEAELELYRAALAMPGATYRSVSAKTGIPKSTLQRLVPRNKNGTAEKGEEAEASTPGAALPPEQVGSQATAEHTTRPLKPEDGDDGITDAASQGSSCGPDTPREDAVAGPSKPVPDGEVGAGTHTEPADCIDGNECHDVLCHLEGCRLKSSTQFEAPATPSVGAVASPSEGERVAHPTDAEAEAAMDAAWDRLQATRARRQTQEAGV